MGFSACCSTSASTSLVLKVGHICSTTLSNHNCARRHNLWGRCARLKICVSACKFAPLSGGIAVPLSGSPSTESARPRPKRANCSMRRRPRTVRMTGMEREKCDGVAAWQCSRQPGPRAGVGLLRDVEWMGLCAAPGPISMRKWRWRRAIRNGSSTSFGAVGRNEC